jgi:hypothetical protein
VRFSDDIYSRDGVSRAGQYAVFRSVVRAMPAFFRQGAMSVVLDDV